MADGPRRCRIRHDFLLISAVLVSVIGCLSAPFSALADADGSGSCPLSFSSSSSHDHDHHHDGHHHHHDEECGHEHHHHYRGRSSEVRKRQMLPEELAEEEDLRMESSLEHDHHHHHHSNHDLSTLGLWVSAMGCSLLVSLASLICLILLPVLFLKGTPSKVVVDALATFGAGAMLGDAFLHQLPHAFSGGHSHSHDHHEVDHSHSHSLQDLSVGLSVLFGIVLFLLVEKAVRYVEEISGKEGHTQGHGHHHHHHKYRNKLKNDVTNDTSDALLLTSEEKPENKYKSQQDEKQSEPETLHKRTTFNGSATDAKELDAVKDIVTEEKASPSDPSLASPSSLVFGYLNLFSDGVHNFTDGMALGSAFLSYGSVGGWSRTLFLLAHELPQEIGDFGILVRSGFTVSKALYFNFLSALVALVGTALALLLGKDPGQSSLIEGFTAGGFIYIAVAGVLPELNSGSTTFRSTSIQFGSLISGMGVALYISLAE